MPYSPEDLQAAQAAAQGGPGVASTGDPSQNVYMGGRMPYDSSAADGGSQPPGGAPPAAPPRFRPTYTNTNNVGDQINYNRSSAVAQGDALNQDAADRASSARGTRAAYSAYADEAYDPLIGNRGGYNADELGHIYNNPGQNQATDEDLAGNYLTPDETNAVQGNPWSRAAYFDPESDMARQYESSGRQRGAVTDMGGKLIAAASNPNLMLDPAYRAQQSGRIDATASRVRKAVDPTKLRASDAALNDIKMSPEEFQRNITGAGQVIGNASRAAADDVTRRAKAGGMSAMGVAAARGRLENDAAVNKGDAMTNALNTTGAARATRAGTAEGFRMRGEESAADRVGAAELGAGQFETLGHSSLEGQRLGAERDVSNRQMDAATTTGREAIGAEADAANRETGSRNFNTTTGTNLATGIEQDSTARAGSVAANRQATRTGNQGTKFSQGMQVSAANTNAGRMVGDARRTDAAEGRGYLQGQIATNANAEQQDYNRQLGIYGTQGQLQAQATQAQAAKDAQPKWWEKLGGLAVGALGAAAGFKKP